MTRHAKLILISLLCGCAIFAVVFAAVWYVLPEQSYVGSNRDYGYVYSGTKSKSVDFTTASKRSDSLLLFGSSELSTPAGLIPQVPAEVFGKNSYGIDLTYVGEAYDQSLWHAMATGAYATSLDNRKVVIIVSPNWFVDGGVSNDVFKMRFSYSLWEGFCDNANISNECKEYIASRLKEQGISDSMVNAGLRQLPQDYMDDAVYSTMDDLRLRRDLESVRTRGQVHPEGNVTTPDFETLYTQANSDANASTTNNTWSFDDSSYTTDVVAKEGRLEGSYADETLSDTPEYADFDCLCEVCNEAGLEPLVVIAPLNGYYFDYVGVDEDTRSACYARIISIAQSHGIKVADFSGEEYTKGFTHDMVHFGWTGWVATEQAIYEFAQR